MWSGGFSQDWIPSPRCGGGQNERHNIQTILRKSSRPHFFCSSSSIERDDSLDVRRVREHVHRLHPADAVAGGHNARQLERQGLRIARHVDRARRPKVLEHSIEHHRRTSRSWWIQHDEVGTLVREPPNGVLGAGSDEPHPIRRHPIQPLIRPTIVHGMPVLFDSHHRRAAQRQRQSKKPAA